jgi:hypothetical protein
MLVGALRGAAGLVVLGAAGAAAAGDHEVPAEPLSRLPWPYAPLDPDITAERAFESYKRGHCMYAVADAILGQVAERLGPPYNSFPLQMFEYGKAGIHGWGTLCGSLNGAAACFQILSKTPAPLTTALFTWYEREALPDYLPKGAKFPNIPVVAGTPLCHLSVSHWCKAAGKKVSSQERAERCGALSASVARKAVLLLAAQHAGEALPVALSERAQTCGGCHEQGGFLENTRSKMDCTSCHWTGPVPGDVHAGVQRRIHGMKEWVRSFGRASASEVK